jgi:hypothetical protein
VFNYLVSVESFARISDRLLEAIGELSKTGKYIVIGHSLGGVILRDALSKLKPSTKLPEEVFLLGSPQKASRLAMKLARHSAYRLLTGDCGQLLSQPERMAEVPPLTIRCTSVVGTLGIRGGLFGNEVNDGIVSANEVQAPWIENEVRVNVMHTMLPASHRVTAVILLRLSARGHGPAEQGGSSAAN